MKYVGTLNGLQGRASGEEDGEVFGRPPEAPEMPVEGDEYGLGGAGGKAIEGRPGTSEVPRAGDGNPNPVLLGTLFPDEAIELGIGFEGGAWIPK